MEHRIAAGQLKPMTSPLDDAVVTSHWREKRKNPVSGEVKKHFGIDLRRTVKAESPGSPIVAPQDGVITEVFLGYSGGAGNNVRMIDDNGIQHRFLHMQDGSVAVEKDNRVKQGDLIGGLGTTGNSTGPHLHYETKDVNNVNVDPRILNPAVRAIPDKAGIDPGNPLPEHLHDHDHDHEGEEE